MVCKFATVSILLLNQNRNDGHMCDCEAELALSVWFILTVELYPLSGLVTLPQKNEYVLPSFVNFMHTKKKKKKRKKKKKKSGRTLSKAKDD